MLLLFYPDIKEVKQTSNYEKEKLDAYQRYIIASSTSS
ncbi:hypothetical protein X559_0103 [Paenilisteria newyorkensis]|nr:hypothetical protein X559_0103 [Listeria newyorkensis]